jgi:hypothetical protein
MRQESIDMGDLSYAPCRYGNSRILFRGPRKPLDRPYIAFIGGTETYGKFIEKPFPTLVETALRQPCVNFGCVNGGIDAFVNDPTVMEICHAADMTVVQVMGANNLSNRFYSVHPRRNDRFLRASTVLQAIYAEVDFAEFSFTRHLLSRLFDISPERFDIVVHELRQAWIARMQNMLRQIGPHCMLLWFSDEPLCDTDWAARPGQLQTDPLFITASMIDTLRPLVKAVVVVNPSELALAQGTMGMHYPPSKQSVASEMLGVRSHAEAAAKLIAALRDEMFTI